MRYPREIFTEKQNACISIAFIQAKFLLSRGGIFEALRDEGLLSDFTEEVYLAGLEAFASNLHDPKEVRRFVYRRLYRALTSFGFRKCKSSFRFTRKEWQLPENNSLEV